jgi:DNA-binding MarR family transcriptional regulator
MQRLSKAERIPTPTVYRNLNSLVDAGFLDKHDHRPQARGESEHHVEVYEISIKGRIAEAICSYLLYYHEKTPQQDKKAYEGIIKKFESDRDWYMILDSLKWHANRNADLSSIRLDWKYIFITAALWSFEREEQGEKIKDEKIEEFLKLAHDFFYQLDERERDEQQGSTDSGEGDNFKVN